eukprot:gb/GECH01007081.1/.p1 GENE.gb/GECH01007081.1/~~gb/GECH01007081.1/.p1  ORF type:complete len:276 (+),score=90.47 gb/GECH01007081.1/:1-828(+)
MKIDAFNITIPSFEIVGNRIKKHVEFKIDILFKPENKNWKVYHRYSQFDQLNSKLLPQFGQSIPQLPPKSVFRNFDRKFLEERRQILELYLQRIVAFQDTLFSSHVSQFLDFDHNIKLNEYQTRDLIHQENNDFSQIEKKTLSNQNENNDNIWNANDTKHFISSISDLYFDNERMTAFKTQFESKNSISYTELKQVLGLFDFPEAQVSVLQHCVSGLTVTSADQDHFRSWQQEYPSDGNDDHHIDPYRIPVDFIIDVIPFTQYKKKAKDMIISRM